MSEEMQEWYGSGRDVTDPRPPQVQPPNWLAHGIRLCRDGTDGLARHLKKVPAGYREQEAVLCPCGERVHVDGVAECLPCGRLYLTDGVDVFAARLPNAA
jgi:hypothetical protein